MRLRERSDQHVNRAAGGPHVPTGCRGVQVFRGHQLARADCHPRRPRVRAQHPRRRVERCNARRSRLFGWQRRVRHFAGTPRAGVGDTDRQRARLQQRSRRTQRRASLQLWRDLSPAVGCPRWRRRADPCESRAQEDLHRHGKTLRTRFARDSFLGAAERHRHLRRQQPGSGRRLEPGAHWRRVGRRQSCRGAAAGGRQR